MDIEEKFAKLTDEQIEAAERMAYVEPDIVHSAMVRVPARWILLRQEVGGGWFADYIKRLQVGYTLAKYEDRKIWKHVSVTKRKPNKKLELPSWDDLKLVKKDFIGEDRWAYQVLPSEKDYVNQHPYVLHLYSLLEGERALPDFTWGLGAI